MPLMLPPVGGIVFVFHGLSSSSLLKVLLRIVNIFYVPSFSPPVDESEGD